MATSPLRRILWAIDVFSDNSEIQDHIVQTLQSLIQTTKTKQEKSPISIEPLYMLSSDQLNLPDEFAQQLLEQYEPNAKKVLNQKINSIDLPLKNPTVITHRQSSLRSLVQHLIHYGERTSTDLIVVGTHGRNGLSRMFLGSFAETLLLQSPIPTLIVGRRSHAHRKMGTILHPILLEGSPSDSPFFLQVLHLAQETQAKLKLLHTVPIPVDPVFQSGVYLLGGGWIPAPTHLENYIQNQKQIGNRWIDFATQNHVNTELILDNSLSSVVDSILKHIELTQADLVMMESVRGPVACTILGSVVRQVVRLSPCPVWVYRRSI
jgi:nucleotide-binding universal stress UspA family protein